jgi:putative membrane protein
MTTASRNELMFLLGVTVLGLLVSGWKPYDLTTWFLEVFPVLIAIPVLWATRAGFPLTRLLYWLIVVHALILMLGGHYTYARVPLGFWFSEALDLTRNHYDRLGHIAQGFVPAMIAREILLRRSPLERGKWLFFIVTCICMGISVFYEFIEWWTAVIADEASIEFLGTQGDVWDTQWDMFLCMCGAIAAQLLLAGVQDRQLGRPHPAR